MPLVHDPIPALSIVIASLDTGPVLLECLAALEKQRLGRTDVEVIVVEGSGDGTDVLLRTRHPSVQVLTAPPTPTQSVPMLRGLGVAAAKAPIVGLLDPFCLVGEGWISEALRVHGERGERPIAAVGGSVDLAQSERRHLAAWATYLFDYWEFIPPVKRGVADVLPGNNIVYRRSVLGDDEALRSSGFWKAFVNARLAEEGHRFWSSPGLAVGLRRRPGLGPFLESRYRYGRSYAAMRVAAVSGPTRLLRALTVPVLPLVFLARQVGGLLPKPAYWGWFVLCAPLLLVFHTSWAWGELCGYLAGAGGSHDAVGF